MTETILEESIRKLTALALMLKFEDPHMHFYADELEKIISLLSL